jgi:zinc transport system substrate-binding protein
VIESEQAEHEYEEAHGHDHEARNPHVWLDPVLAQQQVANIRDRFCQNNV